MTKAIKRSHFGLQAIAVVDDGRVADFRGIRAAASLKPRKLRVCVQTIYAISAAFEPRPR